MAEIDPSMSMSKLRMNEKDSPGEADDPTSEMRNITLEQIIEREIVHITKLNITTNRIPELLILVPCSENQHVPVIGGKGYYIIRGNKLMDISRAQLGDKGETLLSALKGCGYENCSNNALESMKDDTSLPDEISCSVKMPSHMVSLSDFCEEHDETNFPVLITSNLMDVTSQFKKLSKKIIIKENYRIPYALNESFSPSDSSQRKGPVFAISANSALRWSILINNQDDFLPAMFSNTASQLRDIIMDLHKLMLSRSPVFDSLTMDQGIQYVNKVTNIRRTNEKIRRFKRKRELHNVDYECAKKFKTEYGQKWFTGMKVIQDNDENSGIKAAFTDMTIQCETADITLTHDKGYGRYPDVEIIKTEVTRSWDRNFNCLACSTPHKIIDQELGLNLVLSDQHFPAVIPCHKRSCVAVARFCNLSLPNLYRHVLFPILKAKGSAVSNDRHGATDLIQHCMSRCFPVTLMMCSGTSLIKDGPAGYTQTMQEILYMTCDRTLSKDERESMIKFVIFPAPLIPAVSPYKPTDSETNRLSKYKIEATNMGRVACLRASEFKIMFISNTEFIQNRVIKLTSQSPLRVALEYSFLCGLKAYPNNKISMEMKTLKLSDTVILPKQSRSTEEGALKPAVLAEYSKAVHEDFNQVIILIFFRFIKTLIL